MNKELTRFGYLMNLLNIRITELSAVINVERTSISKWKTGSRNLSVDKPYFDEIVDYFIQKNKSSGKELLEDFFTSIYPKRKYGRDYLKRCIRNYILDIDDIKSTEQEIETKDESGSLYTSTHTTYFGIEGRRKAVMTLLESAEKILTPTEIIILDYDDLIWIIGDMHYMLSFFHRLKNILNIGHKIQIIFLLSGSAKPVYEVHKLFMEISPHENLIFRFLPSKFNRKYGMSIYMIYDRLIVTGYGDDLNDMTSFLSRDKSLIHAQGKLVEHLKEASSYILTTNNSDKLMSVASVFESSALKNDDYFCSSKILSSITMSRELLTEILNENQLSDTKKRRCFESYDLLRSIVENSNPDSISGFYYSLDELLSFLIYDTTINYSLTTICGKLVKMSRQQYLTHFKDTAELLLRDNRYRIILHNLENSNDRTIWCKDNAWIMTITVDDLTCESKFNFCDDIRIFENFIMRFRQLYDKTPSINKDNTKVAELFMKISKGESL